MHDRDAGTVRKFNTSDTGVALLHLNELKHATSPDTKGTEGRFGTKELVVWHNSVA